MAEFAPGDKVYLRYGHTFQQQHGGQTVPLAAGSEATVVSRIYLQTADTSLVQNGRLNAAYIVSRTLQGPPVFAGDSKISESELRIPHSFVQLVQQNPEVTDRDELYIKGDIVVVTRAWIYGKRPPGGGRKEKIELPVGTHILINSGAQTERTGSGTRDTTKARYCFTGTKSRQGDAVLHVSQPIPHFYLSSRPLNT